MAERETMRRRSLFELAGILILGSPRFVIEGHAQMPSPQVTLLSAPLELAGDWGESLPQAAERVVLRMREVSLSGVKLVSDQQPERLRIDEHSSGPAAIWLHREPAKTAWIIVDVGARDWCKLAYQFGHELGHVLCNSWGPGAAPLPPTQWLEEALVEAFSIRGLGLLAASWEADPPFAGDAPFAASIREYRANLIAQYRKEPVPDADIGSWFCSHRKSLPQGVSEAEGPVILAVLTELERDKGCVEDLGAVNRWPGRSGVPVEEYLTLWQASCAEIGASGRLPVRLRSLLGLC
jgi:hypothetical protein